MAKRPRIAITDEERAERRKQERELTERAVAQLRCSAGWQRWLTVRARVGLRRYTVIISGMHVNVAVRMGGEVDDMSPTDGLRAQRRCG